MSRVGPRLVLALTVVAIIVGTFLLPPAEPVEPLFNRLNGVAFAVVGLLACRRPEGRRIGWLCLTVGLTAVLFDVSAGYAETAGPGAAWAYWFGEWMSLPQPVLVLIVLPALFPTGRHLTPRWRWLVPTALVLLVAAMLSAALADDAYETNAGIALGRNPLAAPPSLEAVLLPVFAIVALGGLACALVALASMVLRFRRSRGIERLQLRWLLFGVGALVLMIIALLAVAGLTQIGMEAGSLAESVIDGSFGAVQLVLPASIGIAITRHGLYELDRVVSRTVLYAVVVTVLVAVYLGLVVVLGATARALTSEPGDLVVALSTLAVAALFQPVRQRMRSVIERRFNRARYDAGLTVEAFGRSLRDEVSTDAIVNALATLTRATVHPAHVSLSLVGQAESR